jgi:hypothetical protein
MEFKKNTLHLKKKCFFERKPLSLSTFKMKTFKLIESEWIFKFTPKNRNNFRE